MNTTASPSRLLQRIAALTDPLRARLLLVLEREFTVSELCQVLQLPQSTVSRHLKVLSEEGWVEVRAEATSRWYRLPLERMDGSVRRLWQLLRAEVAETSAAAQDAQRAQSVLAQRRSRSRAFFLSAAGEWDQLRRELFGARADLLALLGLLDAGWVVGDLGCGTGQVSEALAPFVARVVAVDDSPEMLAAARARLGERPNVELRRGSLEALPLEDDALDAAVLLHVLPHVPDPAQALAEVARVLRPGGRLLLTDLTPHDRTLYRQEMGHLWLGFSEAVLGQWLAEAGLEQYRYVVLPADPAAKGPALFAATARKASAAVRRRSLVDRRLGA